MANIVKFRPFTLNDVDFIHMCKNDSKLNSITVGQWHPFSREEAERWVMGCINNTPDYRFWAVCTPDEEQHAVGWVALTKINPDEGSACFHSVVVADKEYRDGLAWIECYKFIYNYAFIELGLQKVYGSQFTDHLASSAISKAFFTNEERIEYGAVVKNGIPHDVRHSYLLRDAYLQHLEAGDYQTNAIIKRIVKPIK